MLAIRLGGGLSKPTDWKKEKAGPPVMDVNRLRRQPCKCSTFSAWTERDVRLRMRVWDSNDLSFILSRCVSSESSAAKGVFCTILAQCCNADNRIMLVIDSLAWESCANVAGRNQMEGSFSDGRFIVRKQCCRKTNMLFWIFKCLLFISVLCSTCMCFPTWPAVPTVVDYFFCLHFNSTPSSTHSQDPAYIHFLFMHFWRSYQNCIITLE